MSLRLSPPRLCTETTVPDAVDAEVDMEESDGKRRSADSIVVATLAGVAGRTEARR